MTISSKPLSLSERLLTGGWPVRCAAAVLAVFTFALLWGLGQ